MFTKKSISRTFSVLFVIIFMLSFIPGQPAHAAGTRYAAPGGTGDCSDWDHACDLQTALTGAASGDEIWVKAGTYKPTTNPADRNATFQLKSGVGLYGGFDGLETTRDERDPAVNVTILSGDLTGDDVGFTNNAENVYHVVTGATGATLDGFTVTGGNADGTNPNDRGGGMDNWSSRPTLTNLTFSGNSATYGGGIFNENNSNPMLTEVTFSNNAATTSGGGMFNFSSSPALTNVTFSSNSAGFGGGMYNYSGSSPSLTNLTFSSNSATTSGGGMYNYSSNPTLTNVTFGSNSASYGGGMYNYSSSPLIRNTVFWGNTAPDGGAQIYNETSTPILSDSVVQDGCPAGSTCTNIITASPLLGTLGSYGGFTQTIPLLPGSSALRGGNGAYCPAHDQRGEIRSTPNCDIGAYESQGFSLSISGGNNQSAGRNSGFVNPLSVTVAPLNTGEPVDGGQVTYTAPVSGASAVISGSPATISAGAASVTATANNILGAYNVSASIPAASPVSFSLENIISKTYTLFLPLVLR